MQMLHLDGSEVEVRNLADGMDPGVGAPGDHQRRRWRHTPEERSECGFELTLHGSEIGLASPPRKPLAVIREIQPNTRHRADSVLNLRHEHSVYGSRLG